MKQYIYIPKTYEVALANEIEIYLNENIDNYTIVIGIYQSTNEEVDISNSLVYSRFINQEIEHIPNGINYSDLGQAISKKLIGFLLEGNFQTDSPILFEQIQNLPDCIIFNSENECLTFINNL